MLNQMMMTMVLMRIMMIAFQIYEAWETDKIISVELWRNLSLCLFAVAGVSLILLGDIRWVICFGTSVWNFLSFQLSG